MLFASHKFFHHSLFFLLFYRKGLQQIYLPNSFSHFLISLYPATTCCLKLLLQRSLIISILLRLKVNSPTLFALSLSAVYDTHNQLFFKFFFTWSSESHALLVLLLQWPLLWVLSLVPFVFSLLRHESRPASFQHRLYFLWGSYPIRSFTGLLCANDLNSDPFHWALGTTSLLDIYLIKLFLTCRFLLLQLPPHLSKYQHNSLTFSSLFLILYYLPIFRFSWFKI